MPENYSEIFNTVLYTLLNSAYNTAEFLMLFVVPAVILCICLLVTSRWIDHKLVNTFGWRSLLLFAWLGTPVHELSHLVACLIGRNEIIEFKLFKPDKNTGSLGYVYHAYNKNSFYQRIIGNSLISIAPFFGGSLVIYALTYFLHPDLLSFSNVLGRMNLSSFASLDSLLNSGQQIAEHILEFWSTLFIEENLKSWQFWLYLFSMISVAFRLSPSHSDFQGFWWPAVFLLVTVFLVHLVLELSGHGTITQQVSLAEYLSSLYALLILALLFLGTTAIAVTIITSLINVFTKRRT